MELCAVDVWRARRGMARGWIRMFPVLPRCLQLLVTAPGHTVRRRARPCAHGLLLVHADLLCGARGCETTSAPRAARGFRTIRTRSGVGVR